MKILKSWLEEYLGQPVETDWLISTLENAGIEIEGIENQLDDGVVVAEVKKIAKHPNADRLQLVQVFDGEKNYSVVCGASNYQIGDKVPLAKIGTRFSDFIIEETEIRGQMSSGMLCSSKELGVSDDHSGILILDKTETLGKKINQIFKADVVLDLSVTPNRGDCLSHFGIARDLAAYLNTKVKRQPISIKNYEVSQDSGLSLNVVDSEGCPRYFARVIKNVQIGPSPDWLKNRLEKVGVGTINNVVDVTNYIMLDLGHPLHSFDFEKIKGKEIIVRRAKNSEKIIDLNNISHQLSVENLVIADKTNPIAIAGVIGGIESGITNETKTVVLEAAYFNPVVIRKSAKSINISTEASYRFERGIDPDGLQYALDKAAEMIAKISGGKIISGVVKKDQEIENRKIKIEYQKIRELLGLEISDDEQDKILRSLNIDSKSGIAEVPNYRHDIKVWQDLAEEVGRVSGYDNIKNMPVEKSLANEKSFYYTKEAIKDYLASCGFSEVMNYIFMSDRDLDNLNIKKSQLLEVKNPLQPENKYLRNSLSFGLTKNIAKNSLFSENLIFEIGKIFTLNNEYFSLGIAISEKGFDLDKFSQELTNFLGIKTEDMKIKELTTDELQTNKIKRGQLILLEIIFYDNIIKSMKSYDYKISSPKNQSKYRGVSKFPTISRDLAFVIDQKVKSTEIIETIYNISSEIYLVELFDEFISDKLGAGNKSLAFHIYMQSKEKTLNDSESTEIIDKVIMELKNKFKAKLRG